MAGQNRPKQQQQQQAVRIDCQRINVLHTGTEAAGTAAVGRGGGGGDGSRVGRKNGALLHQSAAAGTAGESPGVLLCLATLEPKYLPAHLWWIAVLLRARTSKGPATARGAGSSRNRTGRIPPSGVVVRVQRRRRSYRSGCSLHGTNDKVWATVYRLYDTHRKPPPSNPPHFSQAEQPEKKTRLLPKRGQEQTTLGSRVCT